MKSSQGSLKRSDSVEDAKRNYRPQVFFEAVLTYLALKCCVRCPGDILIFQGGEGLENFACDCPMAIFSLLI